MCAMCPAQLTPLKVFMTRGAQIPYQGRPGDEILYGGAWYLWILSTYIAWCHPSGAYSFEMAPRFLEHCASPIMMIFWRREQLTQFFIFALNNKFTTNTCSCSSNRLHVQESLHAIINENPKSASFLVGKYKIQKVTQLLPQKKYRYS